MLVLIATLAGAGTTAAAHEVSAADVEGQPGEVATVDILIDSAAGVAAADVQLNFDPNLLTVVGVTNAPGTPGDEFEHSAEADDGTVFIRVYRARALASGSGSLASVQVRVNPGAPPGMASPLVIARRSLASEFGADLAWQEPVSERHGTFWVVFSRQQDRDGDGLSDYEEQMLNGSRDYAPTQGDTDVANPDSDGDGMRDGWEARHGLNPLANDAAGDDDGDGYANADECIAGTDPQQAHSLPRVAGVATAGTNSRFVLQWDSVTNRRYTVLCVTNLSEPWRPIYAVSGNDQPLAYTNDIATDRARYYRLMFDLE